MKCPKCKKKLPKGSEFCNFCGTAIKKKSKLKLFLIILIIVLILLIAAASFFMISKLSGTGGVVESGSVSDGSGDSGQNNAVIDISSIDTGENAQPGLKLKVDAENVSVGVQSNVNFVVIVPDKSYKAAVIVKEEDNSTLTTLTKQRETSEGTIELYGSYTFVPQESDFMQVRAYSVDDFSPLGFISITEPITDEENEEFVNVFSDLDDYINNLDEELTDSERLDAVEDWLENNDSVAEVTRDEENVYYVTNGGVRSWYTIKNPDLDVMGASSMTEFKSDTDAVSNFEAYEKDSSSLKRSGDEDITYDGADITITNKNTLMLRPTYYSDDGFDDEMFDDVLDAARNAKFLEGGTVTDCKGPDDVLDAIINKKLLDYGNIYICGHGNYQGGNQNNYYIQVLDTTSKSEWERFESKYKDLLTTNINSNDYSWKLLYTTGTVNVYNEDVNRVLKQTHYYAILSSRYIMDIYQNYTFDNPVVWMVSCYGAVDAIFNNFWMDHGVMSMIGSRESVRFLTMFEILESTIDEMYESNSAAKLSSVWNETIPNGVCTGSVEENDKLTVGGYYVYLYDKYSVFAYDMGAEAERNAVNGCIVDREILEEYYDAKGLDYFRIDTIYDDEEDEQAGTFDVYYEHSDTYIWRRRIGNGEKETAIDFTFGGEGDLSGVVKKGTTIRTIYGDGTYNDVTDTSEPLANADITANRFINQEFINKGDDDYNDDVKTDKNGKFTFENIDWGLYTVDVDYSSYEGEGSIILTSNSTDGGEIVARSGKSRISGYVQGYTDSTKTKTEFLKDAEISLTSTEEIDGKIQTFKVKSGSGGAFEIEDIPAGTYEMSITCDDYEDYSSTIEFKKGYEYEYKEDCFILENDVSDMDVILVLDVSGSMSGEPINALKSAVNSFADSMVETEDGVNGRVAVVTFSSGSSLQCGFTKYKTNIYSAASGLGAGGGTNVDSGLSTAYSMLQESEAKKKIIVLMSDGCPNEGRQDSSLISFGDEIKAAGISIYTLGFFSELGSGKAEAQSLMEALASPGYHYEVDSIYDLTYFYDDIASQINGQEYDHIRVACPVDVIVTYNGETLSSAEDSLCTRTSFGTLTFEESEEENGDEVIVREEEAAEGETVEDGESGGFFGGAVNENVSSDNSDSEEAAEEENGKDDETDTRVKVLRLKSGPEYDIKILGTGEGKMTYTVSYSDSEGNYTDSRKFKNVEITKDTVIDTTVGGKGDTVLNVDSDGDGEYDYELREKGADEEAGQNQIVQIIKVAAITLFIIILLIIIIILIVKIIRKVVLK